MDHKGLLSKRISVIAHHILQPEQKDSMCNPSNCSAEKSLIEAERAKASFEVEKLTWYLEGSAQYAQFKQLVASVMEGDDVYFDKNRYDRTREEARAQTMLKMKRVMEAWQIARGDAMTKRKNPSSNKAVSEDQVGFGGTGETISDAFWETMALYDPGWSTKMGVHFGLFQFAINGQGSDEQKAKYADAINNLRIFGCFAMTELGHGSHTRGLETTATYDKESKEFVINSPTITSLKWWIGAAGQTATHAVVYAQLIVNGDCKGLHSFVVQIRSLETGDPMPGINIGDCGAKMGRDGIDNGWIQFNNVRIPRENMLMRWAKVTEEGEYESPPKKELAYGALMGGRVTMVKDSYAFIKKALVIAIRYSAVRRQGEGNNQVLDYQSHQHRLFPILAGAYALQATTKVLAEAFLASREALSSEDLSGLADVHATSAGLKAFCTWWANESLETCRQCLGGHGYSAYSGFAEMLGDFGVMCSWEGDNTVLAQQTARYLMKKRMTAYKGKRLSGFVKYLANPEKTLSLKCRVTTLEDLAKSEVQLEAFRRLAVGWVTETSDRLRNEKNVKKNPNAWNDCLIDLVETAKVHCYFFMANSFIEAVAKSPEEVRPILKKLSDLFVWNFVAAASGPLLANGYITARQLGLIRKYIRVLYTEIRPNAVALVDAFNLPDSVVGSPFGASDGDVYNKYLEVVKNAPGNANKAPWWDTIVKPLLHRPELEVQQN